MRNFNTYRRARQLAELADLGLATARELRAQMTRATSPKEACAIAAAFAQVCDEARAAIEQEAALRRRLGADREAEREAAPEAAQTPPPPPGGPRRVH